MRCKQCIRANCQKLWFTGKIYKMLLGRAFCPKFLWMRRLIHKELAQKREHIKIVDKSFVTDASRAKERLL